MKTLLALILVLMSLPAMAGWKMVNVTHPETAQSVGFIYHVYATGSVNKGDETTKSVGGLRFVCSSTTADNPLLIIYWQNLKGTGPKQVTISNGTKSEVYTWTQENDIMYRPLKESRKLLQTIRTSAVIKLSWKEVDSDYAVTFDMSDFNKQYLQFKEKCKLAD